MLVELNSMDVGFLLSISKLISTCSVLNWNTYERFNKSDITHTEGQYHTVELPKCGHFRDLKRARVS